MLIVLDHTSKLLRLRSTVNETMNRTEQWYRFKLLPKPPWLLFSPLFWEGVVSSSITVLHNNCVKHFHCYYYASVICQIIEIEQCFIFKFMVFLITVIENMIFFLIGRSLLVNCVMLMAAPIPNRIRELGVVVAL
jgi:hypothetical protein